MKRAIYLNDVCNDFAINKEKQSNFPLRESVNVQIILQ